MTAHKHNTLIPAAIAGFPNISIVLPFELRMRTQAGLLLLLTVAANKLEKQLLQFFCKENVLPLTKKLRMLFPGVRTTSTQSIAVMVSPQSGKIYYFTPSRALSNYWPLLPL